MHVLCFYLTLPFTARRSLEERLAAGEHVLCAEGYLLALCRMGYVATGVWVPEFLIDHPEVLRGLHYQFVHAGSDVTEAYQVLCSLYIRQSKTWYYIVRIIYFGQQASPPHKML